MAHVLIVDDDTRLRSLLGKYLREHGFIVSTAKDAAEARVQMGYFAFDLLILDVMMPGEGGLELARSFRQTSAVPILMLTALGEPEDRIAGLESGVDDYLVKPFEPRELLLRIQTILRRMHAQKETAMVISLGRLQFNTKTGVLREGAGVVSLTTGEARLLSILAEHLGMTLSREKLAELSSGTINERSVDVQITRLRQKIEPDPKQPYYLQTVRGEGYVLHAH